MKSWYLPLCAMLLLGIAGAAAAEELKAGDAAPAFRLVDADGNEYTLDDFKGKQGVVLAWFPRAFTPGCTLEANAFAEAMPEFEKAGAQVVGMSADPVDKLKDFSRKECRDKFPVASASPATIIPIRVGANAAICA